MTFIQCENAFFDMSVDISGNDAMVFKPCGCPAK